MEQYEVTWKDYYRVLGVKPDARPEEIAAAYERLALQYHHLLSSSPGVPEYSERMAEVKEAYDVLSDPARRRAYHDMFTARRAPEAAGVEEQTKGEIAGLMTLIAQDVSKSKGSRVRRMAGWSKAASRAFRIAIISLVALLAIFIAGTSYAFVQPQQALAAPFKGVAVKLTEASAAAVRLIEEVRGVAATYERSVVSTALQSMRVNEGLKVVPAVTVPTNDMACFPSPEHCLYPDYLDTRYSQFKYTVDSDGIVQVDKSTATTDSFLKRIEETLSRLKAE
ncbi:MAG: DnaJ domain-containing protein [Chloroflexota bacterium]